MQQLDFTIASATSQTGHNPASNIVNSGPCSDGWMSLPGSPLPQEIVCDFGSSVSISRLQFVSHQSKIAANVILAYAKDSTNWRMTEFDEIARFQFSDNRQNEMKAREVQTANLTSLRLRFLKIVFTKAHANRQNPQNQIGLVSLSAFGTSEVASGEDPEIMRLEREKREAAEAQDYALAQRLKSRITALREGRARLTELTHLMDDAARQEDFERAQRIKEEISRIQSGGDRLPEVPRQAPRAPPRRSLEPVARPPAFEPVDYPMDSMPGAPETHYQGDDDRPIKPAPGGEYLLEMTEAGESHDHGPNKRRRNASRAKANRTGDLMEFENRPSRAQKNEDLMDFEEAGGDDGLEPLSSRDRSDAEALIAEFGERSVCYFYSKAAANRAKGIRELASSIEQKCAPKRQAELFGRLCWMMKPKLLDDVVAPFVAVTDAVMKLGDRIRISHDSLRSAVEPLTRIIVKRLGDKKKQISAACADFVRWASGHDALGMQSIMPLLAEPLKKPVSWPNVHNRLIMLQELLQSYEKLDSDSGQIINFVFASLDSKLSDVKATACDVCRIMSQMGATGQINRMLQASSLSVQTQNMVKSTLK